MDWGVSAPPPPQDLGIPGKGNGMCEQTMLREGKELVWAEGTNGL